MTTPLLSRLLFALILLSLAPAPANGQGAIAVTVDGQSVTFDQPPVWIGESVFVPMRGVFERLGAEVVWEAATRTIRATRGETTIELQLGGLSATVNGETRKLSQPAQEVGGRTMVPLRFVSEAMGAEVKWNAAAHMVSILTGGENTAQPPPNVPPPPYGNNAPHIESVSHDATAPLRAGDTLTVTLQGDPGAEASFDIYGVVQQVGMKEVNAGTYQGTVQIPADAPRVKNAAVFGRLTRRGREAMMPTPVGVTIAGPQASIAKILPRDESVVTTGRPNILIVLADNGDSRIVASSARLRVNGAEVTSEATVNEDVVSYVPSTDLRPGKTTVVFSASDTAGNRIQKQWSFVVEGHRGRSTLTHSAVRPLRSGEVLTVTLDGEPGGQAFFDIGTFRRGIPLPEVTPGHYVGNYSVQPSDFIQGAPITSHLNLPGQPPVVVNAATPVTLGGDPGGGFSVALSSPSANQPVGDSFNIIGHTVPEATVSVRVKVDAGGGGSFQGDIMNTEVQADPTGEFHVPFSTSLPFRGGSYTITVVARNLDGARTAPFILRLTRR